MRSGVQWNEDYEDPKSDVGRLVTALANNRDETLKTMAALPRATVPGTRFVYKTGESNLLGVLVARATGKSLSQYLSEKIWAPFGMERDAVWVTSGGSETGGCCISMTLGDYGRFALFFLANGVIGDKHVLPDGWNRAATTDYSPGAFGSIGYGYQWWPHTDGSYEAIGIFGQSIFVEPRQQLIVISLSAWPEADWQPGYERKAAFLQAVRAAVSK